MVNRTKEEEEEIERSLILKLSAIFEEKILLAMTADCSAAERERD